MGCGGRPGDCGTECERTSDDPRGRYAPKQNKAEREQRTCGRSADGECAPPRFGCDRGVCRHRDGDNTRPRGTHHRGGLNAKCRHGRGHDEQRNVEHGDRYGVEGTEGRLAHHRRQENRCPPRKTRNRLQGEIGSAPPNSSAPTKQGRHRLNANISSPVEGNFGLSLPNSNAASVERVTAARVVNPLVPTKSPPGYNEKYAGH